MLAGATALAVAAPALAKPVLLKVPVAFATNLPALGTPIGCGSGGYASIELLPGLGHFTMNEAPQQVNTLLAEFIDALGSAGADGR